MDSISRRINIYCSTSGLVIMPTSPKPTKGMLGFREDFEQGPPFVPMYLSGDNCIVTAYYPQTLIEYASKHKVSGRLQQLIDGLNENDNLVIAIAKLK